MSTNVARRPLTNLMISTVATGTNRPCGDGIVPASVGWQGQPNASGSNFIPYTVLQVLGASFSMGSFNDPESDWRFPYNLWSFGVRRDQCEAMADIARQSLSGLQGNIVTLGNQQYSIQQVRTDSIGGIVRYDQVDPPYWGQNDTVTVWISKELS